jgi:hypothetical protein
MTEQSPQERDRDEAMLEAGDHDTLKRLAIEAAD